MFFFDPLYLLFAAPGFLLSLWAQSMVKSRFNRYSQVPNHRGLSGAEVAAAILRQRNISNVRIEQVQGRLTDHYDPRGRVLRLSPEVYGGRSVAAAGIAAHEVGHALQHAESYAWLNMRSNLVPALKITSSLAMPTLMIGLVLSSIGTAIGNFVMIAGLVMFATLVLFQLVTLPVEFDASKRALQEVEAYGLIRDDGSDGARKVLNAAALTYVAAAVSSLMTLLYFLIRSGLLGGNRD